MAKRKNKFSISLSVIIALACAVVMVVAYFLPYMVAKTEVLGFEESTTSNGIYMTEMLFNLSEHSFGTFCFCLGAFCCIILGGLLLLSLLGALLTNNATLLTVSKAISALSLLISILGLVGGFIVAGDTGVSLGGLASGGINVGIGAYLFTAMSLVSLGSLFFVKK